MFRWLFSFFSAQNKEAGPVFVAEEDPFLPNQYAKQYQMLDWAVDIIKNGASKEERRKFLARAEAELAGDGDQFLDEFERIRSWAGDGIYPENGVNPDFVDAE